MKPIVFLSPHLDDAVLSCAGRILHHVARGEPVVVLTVFSHADPDDEGGWAARREEDWHAVTRLGAQPQWLGLQDAPFRSSTYADDPYALFGPLPPEDRAWFQWLGPPLQLELARLDPSLVYVPLGVGDHVDHRLVHQATADTTIPRLYYEERPYALVPHAVHRRLDDLGFEGSLGAPPPSDEYLEALMAAPYVQALLPDEPEAESWRAALAQWPRSPMTCLVHPELDPLSDAEAMVVEHAIWEYVSQVGPLYGDSTAYQTLTREYALRLGPGGAAVERYWRMTS